MLYVLSLVVTYTLDFSKVERIYCTVKLDVHKRCYQLQLFYQHRCLHFAVHDEQLVDDIPLEKLLIHDVPVDIICTPTQVIFTNTSIPKPQGQSESLCIC